MATNVHLTAELELQEAEERRRQFRGMVAAAEAEADREGTFTIDSVRAEVNGIIGANEQ
ncbi:MAG: hypothetical protein HQL41_09250 [Alphaproteobacteria bacterium]|nr:hypothetical protein [Alphaproteobacteria bacterium]